MTDAASDDEAPIIHVSRWQVSMSFPPRRRRKRPSPTDETVTEPERWTSYGVDPQGRERVYAELPSKEVFTTWRASDPLWAEAQRAMFAKLLANPGTRDTVLRINIAAALEKGDSETAIALARHLSPEALHQLMTRPERQAAPDTPREGEYAEPPTDS